MDAWLEKLQYEEYYKKIYSGVSSPKNSIIRASGIIEKGSGSVMLDFVLPLPSQYPLWELKEDKSEIIDIEAVSGNGRSIISGILKKYIIYHCVEGKLDFKFKDTTPVLSYGSLKYISTEFPFTCLIDVEKAKKGDKIEIEYCTVDSFKKMIEAESAGISKLYKAISENAVINIGINVLRNTELNIQDSL